MLGVSRMTTSQQDSLQDEVAYWREHLRGVLAWVVTPDWRWRLDSHLDSELPKLEAAIRKDERSKVDQLLEAARAIGYHPSDTGAWHDERKVLAAALAAFDVEKDSK